MWSAAEWDKSFENEDARVARIKTMTTTSEDDWVPAGTILDENSAVVIAAADRTKALIESARVAAIAAASETVFYEGESRTSWGSSIGDRLSAVDKESLLMMAKHVI